MQRTDDIPILGWRLYTADAVLDSRKDWWDDLAADGVQCVVVFYDRTYPVSRDGRVDTENYVCLLHGGDYYWRTADGGFACGTAADVAEDAGSGMVKRGAWLPDAEFRAVYDRAYHDCVWGPADAD